MRRLFTEHPETVGETYTQHMSHAFSFGITMIVSGLACVIHGLLPFLFKTTGSQAINSLHTRMVVLRGAKKNDFNTSPQAVSSSPD